MIQHIFSPEMMQEREKQLILALADCAGAYYDINFTQNRILGTPLQTIDGVQHPICERIGMPQNCPYTDLVNYWMQKIDPQEQAAFSAFFDIGNIMARYEQGERLISHKCRTQDDYGFPMLVVQKIRLYEDRLTGDLLGLAYVTDERELEELQEREHILAEQFQKVSSKFSFLEHLSANLPGGYHRCGGDEGFPLQFVSESFLSVIGWTREELRNELDNKFINVVAPEDRERFMSYAPELDQKGRVNVVYRIRRKDGTRRWVQDATLRSVQDQGVVYQCTLADITDHVEMLNREKEKAEASNHAKSTFLFNASHDIRTPVNAIQGFARIIIENADDPKLVTETAQKLIQSGNTLTTLVNDILEISRIEQGKDDVEVRPMDMSAHMRSLHEMFAEEMAQAGLNFTFESDVEHTMVLGDDLKLTRIAMNLLSNAKKFTAPGGSVTCGVRESDFDGESAKYTLFVRDTGIGMSKEFQQRAFDQFERERTSTESGITGSGLGLAIIKRLCELMNCEYHLTSELGKGTEITVTAPLKLSKSAAAVAIPMVDFEKFKGKRILLVEDNEFNREIARYTLEGANFMVEDAENGVVAVEKVLKAPAGHYDLVLMDIQMPVMDGYTATQEIRNIADPRKAATPIVAMTANAFEEDKRRCMKAGMNGHIGKPINIDSFIQEIQKVF